MGKIEEIEVEAFGGALFVSAPHGSTMLRKAGVSRQQNGFKTVLQGHRETKEDKEVTKAGGLLNWSRVRGYILEVAPTLRSHGFTRVSKSEILPSLELVVKNWIEGKIKSLPSKGRTIR